LVRVIAVGGLWKGVGKTSLTSLLLRHFNEAAAVKITHFHRGDLPSWAKIRDAGGDEYVLIDDVDLIRKRGTDTFKLSEATSGPVRWLQCGEEGAERGVEAVLEELAHVDILIGEGNSFLDDGRADVGLLVVREGTREAKDHALKILSEVDLVAVNGDGRVSAGMEKWLDRLCPGREFLPFDPREEGSATNSALIGRVEELVRVSGGVT
jgi:molybdopterin-guanine dinucleotide biosynthesis protein